jgi:hypothetical protein
MSRICCLWIGVCERDYDPAEAALVGSDLDWYVSMYTSDYYKL